VTDLLFIGECRSITAQRKGWTWKDGRLAAKPLFEALAAMGVDPKAHKYMNLWTDNATPLIAYHTPAIIKRHQSDGYAIVALGKRVSGELTKRGIDHVALVHPAARGKIRKRERYHAHVKEKLAPVIRKVLRIQSEIDNPKESWIESYWLLGKSGARKLRAIPGNGQYAPGDDEILAWFARLGVTHVEVAPGWNDTVPAKIYPLKTFGRHMRRITREAEG
jgi:hypothetical protein